MGGGYSEFCLLHRLGHFFVCVCVCVCVFVFVEWGGVEF